MYREIVKVKDLKYPVRTNMIHDSIMGINHYSMKDVEDEYFYSHFGYRKNDYESEITVDHVVVDIDNEDLTIAAKDAQVVIGRCKGLDIPYNLFFSGSKGFHVLMPNAWAFTSQDVRSKTLKNTIMNLFPEADPAIYTARSLIRMDNTVNAKSGLFKRWIDDALLGDIEVIKQLASVKAVVTPTLPTWDKPPLKKLISFHKPLVKVIPNDELKSPICVNTILENGPEKGERHLTALRIASHLNHYANLPKTSAMAVMAEWWNRLDADELSSKDLQRLFSDVSSKYRFGCKDPVLSNVCSAKCLFYKGRNYMSTKINIKDIYQGYINKIKNHEYIDMSTVYPEFIKEEFIVLNTDLIGIVGSPGAGKSTLAIDMVMRHLANDKESYILLQNLDNSHELSIRRMLQWLTGFNKEQIIRPTTRETVEINKGLKVLENHYYILPEPNINKVDEMIHDWEKYFPKKPTMLIVDHVGILETTDSVGGYDRMRYLGDFLKSIPKRHSVLTIAIGHIRKQDSALNIITAESARDANLGAAADLLIGLTYKDKMRLTSQNGGPKDNPIIIVSSPKARDNAPFEFLAMYDPVLSKFVATDHYDVIQWKEGQTWEKPNV